MWILRGLLAVIAVTLGCSAWAENTGFVPYLFDGSSFKVLNGAGAILVKDGMLPAMADEGGVREDPLPKGSGAVVLYCYRQSSGGKLIRHSGAAAMPGIAVGVRGNGVNIVTRTNSGGYVVLALPEGSYEFKLFGFVKRVVVESGKTALLAMRGSKRMVD